MKTGEGGGRRWHDFALTLVFWTPEDMLVLHNGWSWWKRRKHMGVGSTTTCRDDVERWLSSRMHAWDLALWSPSVWPLGRDFLSAFQSFLLLNAGLDSMFTEPSSFPRFIDWCRLKPKSREVLKKNCLFNPQSFPPFADSDVSLESWKQSLTFPYAGFNSLIRISPQKVRKLHCVHTAHMSYI